MNFRQVSSGLISIQQVVLHHKVITIIRCIILGSVSNSFKDKVRTNVNLCHSLDQMELNTPDIITYRDIPRPAGCGISPLKFEIAP